MALRITKPGFSALDDKSPFILSSEHDYLKRHAEGSTRMTKVKDGGSTDYFAVVDFPDLGYIPLVFYNNQIHHSQSETRIVYPYDRTSSGIEGTWANITLSQVLVTTNQIWFHAGGPNVGFEVDVRYIVFKNEFF